MDVIPLSVGEYSVGVHVHGVGGVLRWAGMCMRYMYGGSTVCIGLHGLGWASTQHEDGHGRQKSLTVMGN